MLSRQSPAWIVSLICVATLVSTALVAPVQSSESLNEAELFDTFSGQSSWISSKNEQYNGEAKVEDGGLVLPTEARRYGLTKTLTQGPVALGSDPLVLQYDVKFSKGHGCSGGYLKFLSHDPNFKPQGLTDQTGYSVMFGPDKCGDSGKVHLIFRYKDKKTGEYEEKHLKSPPKIPTADMGTHVFTAVILPDNTYKVLVDGVVEQEGSLFEDFEPSFLPPKEIDDPEDTKPEDWVDEVKIPDPDATKPDDWDETLPAKIPDESATKPSDWDEDLPLEITDPEAEEPEDWDEEEDGVWEAPMIPNPECKKISGCGPWSPPLIANPDYKGKWMRPFIDNPEYKGPWSPRKIPNPDYFDDGSPLKSVAPIGAVSVEVWTMDSGIIFDNVLVSTNEDHSEEVITKYWKPRAEEEKAEMAKAMADANKESQAQFWRNLISKVDPYVPEGASPTWFMLKEYLMENLIILYVIVGLLPTFLVIMCFKMCVRTGGSKSENDDARRKKTDEATPDDAAEEEEEEEAEEEEEENTTQVRRRTRRA